MPTRRKSTVPADPGQWAEKSQRSVSSLFTSRYEDREYKCWSCGKSAVITTEDQKNTNEKQKAPIDQQRVLCAECWKVSLQISRSSSRVRPDGQQRSRCSRQTEFSCLIGSTCSRNGSFTSAIGPIRQRRICYQNCF